MFMAQPFPTVICPKCQQPTRREDQLKHVKIDGSWTSIPGTPLFTCLTPGCNRQWITLNRDALTVLTDAEAERYPRRFVSEKEDSQP